MEWSRLQTQFVLDHKDLIEKEDWGELYLRSVSALTPFERRHLMLGIAIVAGLIIELDVDSSRYDLFVLTGSGEEITVLRQRHGVPPSDQALMKKLEADLKIMGLSEDLTAKVINRMRVKRA